jgi:hypothetical protein
MVFRTWDLNFGAWIFTLAVSKTETWKLLGRDFQDVGSQFGERGDFTVSEGHGHPLVLFNTLEILQFSLVYKYCIQTGLKKLVNRSW